jgi:ATP-dependent RNA helicase SUPV3L1/SUV3
MVNAEAAPGDELSCEGHIVGRLQGFRFTPEPAAGAAPASVEAADVAGAIGRELELRANRFSEAVDASLVLANDGAIRWLGDPIAKLVNGESLLAPRAVLLADENLSEAARQKAQTRVDLWLGAYVKRLLGPLFELEAAAGLEGAARSVALQVAQALGVLERGRVAQDVKSLDQNARGALRKMGVRFGAYYIYLPLLVKPAVRALATQLWALRQGGSAAGLDELPQFAASGRTSFLADTAISRDTYRIAGFRLCEDRAVRVDIVERLADLIRPAVAYRPGVSSGEPPPGSADGDSFVVTGAMTSLTGCSGESFAAVLRSLGFVSRRIKGPALTIVAPAPAEAGGAAPLDGGAGESAPAEAGANAETPGGAAEAPQRAETAAASETEAAAPLETAPAVEETNAETAAPAAVEIEVEAEAPAAPETELEAAAPETEAEAAAPVAAEANAEAGAPVESGAVEAPAAANAVDAGAPADEPLIEVWRPRPAAGPRSARRAPGKERAPARPAEGEARAGRREAAGDHPARRRRPSFQAPPPAGGDAAPRPQQETRKFRGGRGPRERGEASGAEEVRQDRHARPNKGRASPSGAAEGPPAQARREPPVNMDSPFAKLLALKSQLEAKAKGG